MEPQSNKRCVIPIFSAHNALHQESHWNNNIELDWALSEVGQQGDEKNENKHQQVEVKKLLYGWLIDSLIVFIPLNTFYSLLNFSRVLLTSKVLRLQGITLAVPSSNLVARRWLIVSMLWNCERFILNQVLSRWVY